MTTDMISMCIYKTGEKELFINDFIKESEARHYTMDIMRDPIYPIVTDMATEDINIFVYRRHMLSKKHARLVASIKKLLMSCAALTVNVPTLSLFVRYSWRNRYFGTIHFKLNTKLNLTELNNCFDAIITTVKENKIIDYSDRYLDHSIYNEKTKTWEHIYKEKEEIKLFYNIKDPNTVNNLLIEHIISPKN